VFSGMLGVTVFGLLLTPLFYVLARKLSARATRTGRKPSDVPALPGQPALGDSTG